MNPSFGDLDMRQLRAAALLSCFGVTFAFANAAEPTKVVTTQAIAPLSTGKKSVAAPPVKPVLPDVPAAAAPGVKDASKATNGLKESLKDPLGTAGNLPSGASNWLKPGAQGEREFNPASVLPNGGKKEPNSNFTKNNGSPGATSLDSIRGGFAKDGPAVGTPGDYSVSERNSGTWTGRATRRTSEDGQAVSVSVTMYGPGGQSEHFAETRSDQDKDGYAETLESRSVEYSNGDGKTYSQQTTRNADGTYTTTTVRVEPDHAPTMSRITTESAPAANPLGHIKTGTGAGGAGCVDPYSTSGGKELVRPGEKPKAPKVVEAVQNGAGKQVRPDDTPRNETPRIVSQGRGTVINPGPVDSVYGGTGTGPTGARMLDQGKLVNPGRDPRQGSEKK
jgi:hypothetical protein